LDEKAYHHAKTPAIQALSRSASKDKSYQRFSLVECHVPEFDLSRKSRSRRTTGLLPRSLESYVTLPIGELSQHYSKIDDEVAFAVEK
jgi:hypothetical protein